VLVSAKTDYGMRAALALAGAGAGRSTTARELARVQDLPAKYLGAILNDLRRGGIVVSRRGAEGGYVLARPPSAITVAQVMEALGALAADVRGQFPGDTPYEGDASHLAAVWVAMGAGLRRVLEAMTLEDVLQGRFPAWVARLSEPAMSPGAGL
jgi:Rrf2 family protein